MTMLESEQEQKLTTDPLNSPPPQRSVCFSPSAPPPQRSLRFLPSTPPRQPPKRNPKDHWSFCKRLGRWSVDCPSKTQKKSQSSSPGSASSSSSSSPMNGSDLPILLLRCLCGGVCKVFTSKTNKNPGRKFYTCPLDQSVGKCNFFKWCDEVVDKYKPPLCPCGAGTCSLNVASCSPYKGRWYFACPIETNHGGCLFFQWLSSPVKTTLSVSADESKGYSSPQSLSTNHQVLKTVDSNSCEEDDWSSEEFELAMVQSLDYHSNLLMNSLSKKDDVPDTNLVKQETESQDTGVGNKLRVPQVSVTEIQFQQTEFSWKVSAAGVAIIEDVIYQILRFHVHGWLGRLAFPPPHCLKEPPATPSFCCILPPIDPVRDDVHDIEGATVLPQNPSNDKTDIPQLQSLSEAHPVLQEPPCFRIVVQNNDISSAALKTFGKGLLDVLQSMDQTQHETMLKVAESTFNTLSYVSVNYEPFSKAVKEYIHCVSRRAVIEGSMGKDFSSEAFICHYNDKKSLFDSVSQQYAETVSAHDASENRLKLLREEYSCVKDKLLQLEEQISLCEDETSRLQSRIVEISKDMSELSVIVDAASENAAEAMELEHEWDSMLDAANAALHNAMVQLQQ